MNNDNVVHEEKRAGATLKIVQDYNSDQTPDDNGDKDLFLVGFHRDFTVEREGFKAPEIAIALAGGGDRYDYASIPEADRSEAEQVALDRAEVIKKEYHLFGLEAYIHGGVSLSLSQEGNFPDRRWDVSQLGAVLVSRKEQKDEKKARKLALGLIEEWNNALSGNVYGFVIEDERGEHLDSCWGFSGDWEKSGILDEARSALAVHMTRAEIRKRKEAQKAEDIKTAEKLVAPYKLKLTK